MTVQQQVCNRIINMSDEGAAFINQVINNMNPVFLMGETAIEYDKTRIDVSKRIGIGKNIIEDPENFDNIGTRLTDCF